MLSENIWFTCCKPSNYPIIGEGKSDYGQTDTQTDTQTDRISYLRLDPFCGRGRVKILFWALILCSKALFIPKESE